MKEVKLNIEQSILTIEDICDILRVGRNCAYLLLNTKSIKAFKVGTTWKIPKESLEEFITESCENGTVFDFEHQKNKKSGVKEGLIWL